MSRFKPSPQHVTSSVSATAEAPVTNAAIATAPEPAPLAPKPVYEPKLPERTSPIDKLGYFLFCTYIISGHINEWTLRLLGSKAYISIVVVLALPVVFLISNNRFRGLKSKVGIWWIGFLLFMLIDAPFSAWRSGTLALIQDYVTRSYFIYFFIVAFSVTVARCRGLMYLNIIASAIVLLNCFTAGAYSDDGRLRLAHSLFFANANDLALQLLTGIVQFVYLFREGGIFKKLFSVGCILLSGMYMLRTGSRGCMISAFCYGVFLLLFSKNRLPVLVVGVIVGIVGVATLPTVTFQRLMSFGSGADQSALGSELERRELLRRSVIETFKHPLFGVGPGQFAVYVVGEKNKAGEWASWVGTHNSYTQVSAECGIPAFICYCSIILLCFKMNFQVFRATRGDPNLHQMSALSFALLGSTIVYSVSTFFFHMAYSGALPGLSGLTVALYLASKPAWLNKVKPAVARTVAYARS